MERRHDGRGFASGAQALAMRQRDGNGGQPEVGDFGRVTGKPMLRVVLVDVDREHRRILQQAYLAAGFSPVFQTSRDMSAGRLSQWGDLVVVEADLSFGALHLAERVRRAGMCPVCVLLNWWSDLEWEAHQAADFVLHVPLTLEEIREGLSSTIWGRTDGLVAAVVTDTIFAEQAEASHPRTAVTTPSDQPGQVSGALVI
jgi:hypothetical protein